MRVLRILAGGLATVALAGNALAAPPVVRLLGGAVPVIDGAGVTQTTISDLDELSDRYGNAAHRVVDGDAANSRVRLTPFGQPALWIDCRHLAPLAGYCGDAADAFIEQVLGGEQPGAQETPTRGFSLTRERPRPAAARPSRPVGSAPPRPAARPAADAEGRLPECPGDPRCP